MTGQRKIRVWSGLTMASSLAWMSILPAAAVLAKSTPTVTPGSVSLSGPIRPTNDSATFTASASDPGGTAEYQFWVESPTGVWSDMQNYSTKNTFTLATPSQGDYLVVVDVMDKAQVAAGDWGMAQTTLPDGVFNGSTVSVASSASGEVAKGTSVTLTATASGIFGPLYQFWYQEPSGTWVQSGPYHTSNTFSFTTSQSGTYKYVAYAKSPAAANNQHGALLSNIGNQVAYGTASQVVATPSSPSLVADGQASDTVTFTVEDSHGNRVANFSGAVSVALSSPSGSSGDLALSGLSSGQATVTSGTATVSVTDNGYTAAPFTVSASDLTPAGASGTAVSYANATATVSGATPSAAGLELLAIPSALANNVTSSATVYAVVTDQAGYPLDEASQQYSVALSLSGDSATFASGSATDTVATLSNVSVPTLSAPVTAASATVEVPSGATGAVAVHAAAVSGLLAPAAPIDIAMQPLQAVATGATVVDFTAATSSAAGSMTLALGYDTYGGTLAPGTLAPGSFFAVQDSAVSGATLSGSSAVLSGSHTVDLAVTIPAGTTDATLTPFNSFTVKTPSSAVDNTQGGAEYVTEQVSAATSGSTALPGLPVSDVQAAPVDNGLNSTTGATATATLSGTAYSLVPYTESLSAYSTVSAGGVTVLTPAIVSGATVTAGTSSASNQTLAVWPNSSGTPAYYVDLTNETEASYLRGYSYVGFLLTAGTGGTISEWGPPSSGTVTSDGNTSASDPWYVPVGAGTMGGTVWSVPSAATFQTWVERNGTFYRFDITMP